MGEAPPAEQPPPSHAADGWRRLIPVDYLEAAAFANAEIAQSLATTNRDLARLNEAAEISCEVAPFGEAALRDAFTLRPGAIPKEPSQKRKSGKKRHKEGGKKHRKHGRKRHHSGTDAAAAPVEGEPKQKRRKRH